MYSEANKLFSSFIYNYNNVPTTTKLKIFFFPIYISVIHQHNITQYATEQPIQPLTLSKLKIEKCFPIFLQCKFII